jgi:hypothetical protein
VVGVIVHLPFLTRAVCLPVLARLWLPGDPDHTPLILARNLLDLAVAHLDGRPVHLVGDAAYIGQAFQHLPAQVHRDRQAARRRRPVRSAPTPDRPPRPPTGQRRATPRPDRARRHDLPPVDPGRRGLLRQDPAAGGPGPALPVVRRAQRPTRPGHLVRPTGAPDGYELALVTTDLAATPAAIIERYANRWSEETMFLDARHLAGVGQARTRTKRSVQRLVPFGLCCLSLAICWYARHGQPAHDLAAHRARAPWYRTKRTVSVADMLTALRRALLATQYQHGHPDQHTLDLFADALLTRLNPAA